MEILINIILPTLLATLITAYLLYKEDNSNKLISSNDQPDLTKTIIDEFNVEFNKGTNQYFPKRNNDYFYVCSSFRSGYTFSKHLTYEKKEIYKSSYEEAIEFIDEFVKKNYSGTEVLPYKKLSNT